MPSRPLIITTILVAALTIGAICFPDHLRRAVSTAEQFFRGAAPTPPVAENPVGAAPENRDDQIRELNLRLAQKDAEIFALEQTLREFERFRVLLPNVKMLAARVSHWSFWDSAEITVDVGAADGAQNGWGAAQGAVLVGIVGQTNPQTSQVLLTSNPGCLVPARAEKSRDLCAVRGAGNEKALAVFYTNQSASAPGEKLLTSGYPGKIPPGLIIGTLEEYPRRGANPGTLEAAVKLDANFSGLEHVLLVAPATTAP